LIVYIFYIFIAEYVLFKGIDRMGLAVIKVILYHICIT